MAKKTDAERLADIDKKLEQLKAQKQSLIAREKEKERKESGSCRSRKCQR